jgi:hypothetical protein
MKSCDKIDLHFGSITNSPSNIVTAFCQLLSVQAFESMDDPHIQLLQMACAIWGEKSYFNTFQSSAISCVCSTLVSDEQHFLFLSLSGNPIAQETTQKRLKSSMNLKLLCIWWGVLLHF